jgi:hypothetical protein
MSTSDEDTQDWVVTPEGLYIATRGFLLRRGYCCANRCRNCPYVNWRHEHTWQPGEHRWVQRVRVSANALAGAHALLRYHEQQLTSCTEAERSYHAAMSEHYRFLLQQWQE